MGSVECATKKIGYPDQGLIQKIHQMPFCEWVKFMDISLSCAFFFAPLPPAPVCTPHMHPSLLMEPREYLKYLNEVRNQER